MATGAVVKVLSQSPASGGHSSKITCVALNPKNHLQLYTASLDGNIKLWDFNDDILLKTYNVNAPIQSMVLSPETAGYAYIVVQSEETKDKLSDNTIVYRFAFGNSDEPAQLRRICSLKDCTTIDIAEDGKWLAFGARYKAYVWPTNKSTEDVPETQIRHHVFVEQITVLKFHPHKPILAVGDKSGKITCIANYNSEDTKDHVRSIHHWHHLPVGCITFMADGSYMLSGGEESVMVIWQLDTGHKQFLPRLGGSIASITISPNHRFYCLGLDDNSIRLVNSVTQSIEQVIQGLQYAQADNALNPLSTGLIIEPRNHHIVLNGVQGSLQFYNAVADSHVMDLEVVPMNRVVRAGEKEIIHAHVAHVAFLHNGEWMATVDMRDDKVTTPELFLKFWRWDPDTQGYKLHTRVDYPHIKPITSLIFNPVSRQGPMAITTSEDKTFKVWNLSTDLGRSYQNGEAAWVCRSVGVYRDSVPCTASFSEDGSILAVAFGQATTIWDPYSNSIQAILAQPNPENIEKLSFLGENCPFLIAKSKSHLYVWNILTCKVWWSYKVSVDHLAIDTVSNLFAIVRNHPRTNESRITVFEPKSPVPIALQHLKYTCLSIAWLPKEQQEENTATLSSALLCLSNKYEMIIHTIKSRSALNSKLLTKNETIAASVSLDDNDSTDISLLNDMYGKRENEKETDEQTRIRLKTVQTMREEAMSANKKDRATRRKEDGDVSGLSAPSHVLPGVETLFDTFMSSIMTLRISEGSASTTEAMEIDGDDETMNNDLREQEQDNLLLQDNITKSVNHDLPSLISYFAHKLERNPASNNANKKQDSSSDDDDSDEEEDPAKIDW
ncbi:WD40-repeat-containing domain protein [Parasitella parasitica]|nr:WD40-repeat-containing domain protein [Parasitella parasitica]